MENQADTSLKLEKKEKIGFESRGRFRELKAYIEEDKRRKMKSSNPPYCLISSGIKKDIVVKH